MDSAPRKRNADATKEAILVAARQVFTDNGFDGAGLREIASLAGVNVALINRYFGSKDKLFKIAIMDHLELENMFSGDISTIGERLADYFLSHDKKKVGYDPTLAILRSTSSESSVKAISSTLEESCSDILKNMFPDADSRTRRTKSGMLVSVMLGYDMMRRVFQISALDDENADQIRVLLAQSLQGIIDAEI